jgi:uncharacterized membrane protein
MGSATIRGRCGDPRGSFRGASALTRNRSGGGTGDKRGRIVRRVEPGFSCGPGVIFNQKGLCMREPSSTQRIEAFSDGVFSIAITLLILEVQIPNLDTASTLLSTELWHLWPAYLAYIMSFIMIGIYWANHHYVFRLYRGTNHVFNLINLFFLMCISFLPFPTSILSRDLRRPGQETTAVMFYAFGLLLPALGFLFMWLYATGNHRLVEKNLAPGFIRLLKLKYALSCVIYTAAILIAHWYVLVGLGICVGLTFLYLAPSRDPWYTDAPVDDIRA